MPIDRTDPADDPEVPRSPDSSRQPDAIPPPPLSPADREAAHRAYRARVDRIHAADSAGGTWAEAAPRLRAEWSEHQERYPERVRAAPQTHPDKSWSSGDRRLAPDQNIEATKACADIHDEGERAILPAMRHVEEADPDRRLAGLQHMLKGVDRLKEKVAEVLLVESTLTPRQALDKVPDAVRYSITYEHGRYADGVRADVERLKADGFEEIKLKNLWPSDQYKGINSQWRRPDTGLRFEVQFHTVESLEAKELTHSAYERLRRSETETTPAERNELEEFQHRVNALLVTPPGTEDIKDFPERKR